MDESSKEKATYSGSHCSILDALKAFLNCLGVEWKIKEHRLSLELKNDNKSRAATFSQEPAQNTATTFTNRTALEAHPPTNIIPFENPAPISISLRSVPSKPPVSGGGGPKIN